MAKYYDWAKTLSYDADITMVCGARGIGKTYGLRLQCIRDYLNNGFRFAVIMRTKEQMRGAVPGYFTKIVSENEFPDVKFRTEGRYGYIATKNKENGKPDWELLCYFIALTDEQVMKTHTFANVKRLVFDEFIIDRKDRYHNYLADEWTKVANLVSTVSRERADDDSTKPKLYLLGNALDLVNPYFSQVGINKLPKKGYSWHANKMVLLHYSDDAEYSEEMATKTLAGKMLTMADDRANVYNEFLISNQDFIAKKTPNAHFIFGIVHNGKKYGIWGDNSTLMFYANRKIVNNTNRAIYAITSDDSALNYKVAKRGEKQIVSLVDVYREGHLYFDTEATRRDILEILAYYGIRV